VCSDNADPARWLTLLEPRLDLRFHSMALRLGNDQLGKRGACMLLLAAVLSNAAAHAAAAAHGGRAVLQQAAARDDASTTDRHEADTARCSEVNTVLFVVTGAVLIVLVGWFVCWIRGVWATAHSVAKSGTDEAAARTRTPTEAAGDHLSMAGEVSPYMMILDLTYPRMHPLTHSQEQASANVCPS
jgi:hypothetical protein